jgi:hypothetical protein
LHLFDFRALAGGKSGPVTMAQGSSSLWLTRPSSLMEIRFGYFWGVFLAEDSWPES